MIEVSPAHSPADMDLVYRLTHDAWVDEGLIEPRPSGRMTVSVRATHLASDLLIC
jgi:hypothetical protein